MRHKLLAAAAIAAGVLTSGCAYYEYGTGERTIKVYKFGMKTEIGELEAATPQGSLRIKGLTSDGTSVTEKLVDRIPIPVGFAGGGGTGTTTVVPVPVPTPAPAVVAPTVPAVTVPLPAPVPAPVPVPAPAPSLPDPGDPTIPVQPVFMDKPKPAPKAARPATRPAAKGSGKAASKAPQKPAARPEPAPLLVRVATTQPAPR